MKYLLVLLLAGCAYTPKEIREQNERFDHQTTLAPTQAAACLGHAIEDQNMQARWRDEPGGRYEVIGSNAHGFMLIADVTPSASGSDAAIYVQGGTEHTHGISSSLLSNVAVRTGEIVESMVDRRAQRTNLPRAAGVG